MLYVQIYLCKNSSPTAGSTLMQQGVPWGAWHSPCMDRQAGLAVFAFFPQKRHQRLNSTLTCSGCSNMQSPASSPRNEESIKGICAWITGAEARRLTGRAEGSLPQTTEQRCGACDSLFYFT